MGEAASSEIRSWMIRNVRQVRKIFVDLDTNGDGTLSMDEAVQGLQGINDSGLSVDAIHAAVANLDRDGSGYLDYAEFVQELQVPNGGWDSFGPRVHAMAALGDSAGLNAELAGGIGLVNDRCKDSAAEWKGRTPLMTASFAGQLSTVASLLKQRAGGRADVHSADSNGWTALHGAAAGGHAEVVRSLCRAGADVNRKNDAGRTAGDLASLYGYTAVTEVLLPYVGR